MPAELISCKGGSRFGDRANFGSRKAKIRRCGAMRMGIYRHFIKYKSADDKISAIMMQTEGTGNRKRFPSDVG